MKLLKIGRHSSCDIVINSNAVSSLHAEITMLNNGDILLEDKGSTNGTFVMNQPIQPGKSVNIRRGDAVRFGDTELNWAQVPMPEDNSAYKRIWGIGTHFNNEKQVSGNTISRYHATIKQDRKGKFFIIDHSKNGTTVDGRKLQPNNIYPLKKKQAVVCGGVPVDTSFLPWPTWDPSLWKIAAVVVVLLALGGVGIGITKMIGGRDLKDTELYARYNNSLVMLAGVYHYEVTVKGLPGFPKEWVALDAKTTRKELADLASLYMEGQALVVSGDNYTFFGTNDLSRISDYIINHNSYTGTGFFVSKDGRIVTNQHMVKPWLYDGVQDELEVTLKVQVVPDSYNSLISVEGKLDQILLFPQGRYVSSENATKCRLLSCGDVKECDVAIIQSDKGELPSGATFVNVKDSMVVEDNVYHVGEHMYTIGYPFGSQLQDLNSEKGLQASGHGGDITQQDTKYTFGFDAASYHGASGSPVFNRKGMLIGVLNKGVEISQGFNYAVKTKYVRELLDKSQVK